ncbi:MAG: 2-acyl-glycerophospho-ethanolamine acyltransferase [Acidobacteria bacterium ADurb.Bin340]|jgi:lyso-ornithine lipid O-acyltransferase|nr:MAG: 2-acyl-glycerophospho-ethanolamine acyltransferase [Acidobacteria bacterium ADurb.Bin340]
MVRMALSAAPEGHLAPFCGRLLKRLRVEVRLAGPLPADAPLWVANHLSWLDPIVLLSLRPAGVLAKAEVADYPLIGWGARRAGLHFVQREDALSRAAALVALGRALGKGEDFLVFPEGTTTRGEGLAPLQEGSLRAAWRMGTPVLPLRLGSPDQHYPWTGSETLLPHLRGLARTRGARVDVAPGPRLLPEEFSSESAFVDAAVAHLDPHRTPLEVSA